MASERHYLQACERAAVVLQALAALELTPSPENYRIWYVHQAGEDPALSHALNAMLESGERVTEAHAGSSTSGSSSGSPRSAPCCGPASGSTISPASSTARSPSFSSETARYGSTLSEARERVSAAPNGERIRQIVRGMVEETIRMQNQAAQVEGSLRARMSEIDGLRRDLQTAWSEARTDGLTGLANRKHFDQALRVAAAQAIEHGAPACLLLADIDHFKNFNDVYGHLLGDQVLKLVANLLRHNVKGQDLVARYGGEEFAVILPATRLTDATTLADRLRELVGSRRVQLKDRGQSLGRVTLSIGVTDFRPGESCADWVARSDTALYAGQA